MRGKETVNEILNEYKNHSSIIKNNAIHQSTDLFDFAKASTAEINRITKPLNPNKGTSHHGIPLKIIHLLVTGGH